MTVAVCEPIAAMSSCLDSLRGMLGGLDDNGITQALRDIEDLSRKTQSVMLDVVADFDARGLAVRKGFSTNQQLVAGMLRLSAVEARMRVEQAAMVGARHAITGETLAPRLPATAAALAAGEIGTGQLRVIIEAMTALTHVDPTARAGACGAESGRVRPRLRPPPVAHRRAAAGRQP